MENFVIIIVYLLIGMAMRRIPQFHDETANVLSLYVIYVSLPAVVLLKIPVLAFSSSLLAPVLLPWVMLFLSCVAVLLISRTLRWSRRVTGCLLLLVPLGNTSFLGIPMVTAFFGEQAVSYALLYDQLGSFLALATYGSIIIAVFGGENKRPSPQEIGKKILTFPPFVALLLAFFLRQVPYPPVIVSILESLGVTLVPVVMIAVGFQLKLRLSREAVVPLAIGLALKLVAAPLLALVLCRAAGIGGEAVRVSIFEAGMPPMVSAGALAILAGLSPELTAALVGFGIVLSFVTLPLIHLML